MFLKVWTDAGIIGLGESGCGNEGFYGGLSHQHRLELYAFPRSGKADARKGKGAIVFITSDSALRVTKNRCAYCSSESTILAMSKSFAVDWDKYGIRSNCVLPGMIKTEHWQNNVNNTKYCLPNYTPIRDIAEFEDVANAAWYPGSDQLRNTAGAELVVDGGMLAQLTPNINRKLWEDEA